MIKQCLALAICLLTGCAHVATTRGTFRDTDHVLRLRLDRHLDTVLNGLDLEEDQTLVLELKDYSIGRRIPIPSPQAAVGFRATRFGPTTEGLNYVGYVIVRNVTPTEVTAALSLALLARTTSGSYEQKVKYSGDYVFRPEAPQK
jgi:hypothetical protein